MVFSSNALIRVSLRNLAAHKIRLALTVLSVVLGTAFLAGSIIFTATISGAFSGLFDKQAVGVGVRISSATEGGRGVPDSLVAELNANKAELGISKVLARYVGKATIAGVDGLAVPSGQSPSLATNYVAVSEAMNPAEAKILPGGKAPTGLTEIVINQSAAERGQLIVGSKTKIVLSQGLSEPFEVTVVGIVQSPKDVGKYIEVQFSTEAARKYLSDAAHASYVDLATAGNSSELKPVLEKFIEKLNSGKHRMGPVVVTPPSVAAPGSIPSAAGPKNSDTYKFQTATEVRETEKAEVNKFLDVFNYILAAFAAVGLIVGTFIIYNTFAMIVAQRVRELALLRAIGAERHQIMRSVLAEAGIVGLVGSAMGLLTGILIAAGLRYFVVNSPAGLPAGELKITGFAVIASLVVGVGVTLLSAYAPARRASTVAPVEAMRESATDGAASLKKRTIFGIVSAAIGLGLMVFGSRSSGGIPALIVGVGAVFTILAVVLSAPALSQPFMGTVGKVVVRPFKKIGQLAQTNAIRNPRRTAATAFALTLGLMLVAIIGTLGQTFKAAVDDVIDDNLKAGLIVTGRQGTLPASAVQKIKALPGVAEAISLSSVPVKLDGDKQLIFSPSGDYRKTVIYQTLSGSSELGDAGILVSKTLAAEKGWKVGRIFKVAGPTGLVLDGKLVGTYADNVLMGPIQIGRGSYNALVPENLRNDLVITTDAAPGTDVVALHKQLTELTKQYLVVKVENKKEYKETVSGQINQMLTVLYAMLALALVIAVLGIINTLALSVIERKREIGMLRAIGTSRRQVRRTIYLESVLIAMFGAILGVTLGIIISQCLIPTFTKWGLGNPVLPWNLLAITVLAAVIVGVFAALWPAATAARTKPLEALG